MWNSVLMDGAGSSKWSSFDRSPLIDDESTQESSTTPTQFRASWDFKSHQQTNYADWSNGHEDDSEDLFAVGGPRAANNYPSAAELFRNFVGDEGADRMEFYINHLTSMEGCDANNIAAALMSDAGIEDASVTQNVVYRPPFPLLETIAEETMEELLLDLSDSSSASASLDESSESPSSNSGRWGWGWGWLNTSDDDSSSVIHVPVGGGSPAAIASGSSVHHQSELTDINSGIYRPDGLDLDFDLCNDEDDFDEEDDDGEWSERDQEVPKKKRRIGSSMDERDETSSTSSRSPSVTESLIQFEALEKELDDDACEEPVIFRTSATSLPFEDADDGIMSPEIDPEVFLDCREHLESPVEIVEASSANFANFFDVFQEPSQMATCGPFTPARTWSSMPSLDRNAGQGTELRNSRSASDVCNSVLNASGEEDQGQDAAARPSQPWVITFDPPRELMTEEDEEVNDDWEPDGFLNSDIEEYDTGSNSDDDDDDEYSTERGDRFDEFGLGFVSGRSQRMRSFRSYGDSLNLLDTADDPVTHSTSSSSSTSCSPDRSSPEEDHRHPSSSRSRRSVEALSEDSGYGDASGSLPIQRSPEELRMAAPSTPPADETHTLELQSQTICPPDVASSSPCSTSDRQWLPEVNSGEAITDDENWNKEQVDEACGKAEEEEEKEEGISALLLRRQPRCRPAPLSLKEAEEFLIQDDVVAEVVNAGESRCGVSGICIDLESKMSPTLDGNVAAATAAFTTNDDILHRPGTDLEASKFNPQIGRSGWEVPDSKTELGEAAADHQPAEEQHHHHHRSSSFNSNGSGFVESPDASKHNSSDLGHNVTYPDSILAMDSAFYPAPVVLKRYGPRQEVEVYISQQQLPVDHHEDVATSSTVVPSPIRGVHFSPVVSAVNWRESYLNQSEDESDDDSSCVSLPQPNCVRNSAELATKVRVAEIVPPSVAQQVKLLADSPSPQPSDVSVPEPVGSGDSGRNGSSNSCTTTSNSGTTTITNSKKPATLFQRFSLSRLSARMSATFSRSESKRESCKKVADAPFPTAESNKNVASEAPVVVAVAKSNGNKKNKNKIADACPATAAEAKPTANKKIDDFKVVKEPKKRFFSRPFQRSSSTPPMSSSVTAPETTVQTRATVTAAAGASGKDNAATSSNACRQPESESHQGCVAKQQTTTTSKDDVITPQADPHSAAIVADDSRSSVVVPVADSSPPPAQRKVQPSHAKPPLPPQTKPRTIHARKNYLVEQQQQQQQQLPPPVPMVSSAGLQHALQHFKETARMERERLANSVPDLVAPPTPTPRPTSDCIDPRAVVVEPSSAPVAAAAPAPSVIVFPGSRERARQAVLSRASSVETAWNATASRAVLNLSRRNIASSSSSSSQDAVSSTSNSTQGHGPTKSRPVVPGLLETNLDSVVPSSYYHKHRHHDGGESDETNLDELIQNLQLFCNNSKRVGEYSQPLSVDSGSATTTTGDKRFKSMLNLGSSSAPVSVQPDIDMMTDPTSSSSVRVPDTNRAKSMEFLLDEDNKSTVQVPENQLKKCGERKMSEHELRIQRSLQKLNVPEWYKNNARSGVTVTPSSNGSSSVTSTGVLRRRDYHGGSVSLRNGGWSGLSSANRDAGTTSSMTSLGSALSRSGTPTRVVIPTRVRPDWRNIKSSRESLSSPADTCNSPSWNGGPTSLSTAQQSFSRWGSGRSSYSACPSPAPSTSSSASVYRNSLLNQHGRQPYLGWRSQERLNSSPAPLSIYQSPAERLASSLLTKTTAVGSSQTTNESRTEAEATPPRRHDEQEVDEVVRSSIRQVTSAIVHYVSESSDGDQPPSPTSRNGLSRSPERHPLEALSRSPSPRRQRCVWVESSFVGGPGGSSPTATTQHRPPPSPIRPESPPSSHHSHIHHRQPTSSATNNGRPGLSDRTVASPLSAAKERDDGSTSALAAKQREPASLDDVLNSLLGLAPPHGPLRRPVSQPTIHNKQAQHHQQQHEQQEDQHQQPYQRQHQQQMCGNNNNNIGLVIQEARSFNDLRSSTYTSTSSNK